MDAPPRRVTEDPTLWLYNCAVPRLLVVNGEEAGRSCPLDGKLLIGRESSADLSLNDPAVSRRHALLAAKAGGWSVIDLQTRNGTYLNGERIEGVTPLHDGDELALGSVVLRYSEEDTTSQSLRAWRAGRPSDPPLPTTRGPNEAHHARFIAQIAYDIGAAEVTDPWLSKVLSRVLELTGADRGLIGLRSAPGTGVVIRTARSQAGDLPWLSLPPRVIAAVVDNAETLVDTASGRSQLAVPIPDSLEDDKAAGLIQLEWAEPHRSLGSDQLALAQAVAAVLGLAAPIGRGRQARLELGAMQADLALGGDVQRSSLFGNAPFVAGCGVGVHWKPALGIGGDFYTFVSFSGRGFGVVVGDVSGKGVSGALCGARVVAEFRLQQRRARGPADLLTRVNGALAGELPQGLFATAAIVSIEEDTDDVFVANAGHPRPLLVGTGGETRAIGPTGDPALGVAEGVAYAEARSVLPKDHLLALYSDGVSDASDADGRSFGEDRLAAALSEAPRGAEAAVQFAVSRLECFVGQAPAEDDMILVCVSRGEGNDRLGELT